MKVKDKNLILTGDIIPYYNVNMAMFCLQKCFRFPFQNMKEDFNRFSRYENQNTQILRLEKSQWIVVSNEINGKTFIIRYLFLIHF